MLTDHEYRMRTRLVQMILQTPKSVYLLDDPRNVFNKNTVVGQIQFADSARGFTVSMQVTLDPTCDNFVELAVSPMRLSGKQIRELSNVFKRVSVIARRIEETLEERQRKTEEEHEQQTRAYR